MTYYLHLIDLEQTNFVIHFSGPSLSKFIPWKTHFSSGKQKLKVFCALRPSSYDLFKLRAQLGIIELCDVNKQEKLRIHFGL